VVPTAGSSGSDLAAPRASQAGSASAGKRTSSSGRHSKDECVVHSPGYGVLHERRAGSSALPAVPARLPAVHAGAVPIRAARVAERGRSWRVRAARAERRRSQEVGGPRRVQCKGTAAHSAGPRETHRARSALPHKLPLSSTTLALERVGQLAHRSVRWAAAQMT